MESEQFLEHYGVKGMRWGVRKDRVGSSQYYNQDFNHDSNVYRIIANAGSRKLSDIAYVSTNDVDNNRYIHILNHTLSARLFKDAKYETQLVLGVNEPIKAPSIKKVEDELVKLHGSNKVFQDFVAANQIYFKGTTDPKRIAQLTSMALVDDDRLFTNAVAMRAEVKKHFQSLGYNSLLDQNDIKEGLATTPVIVFDPQKTLRVVSQTRIDDTIKKHATKTYKETKPNF